MCVCVPKVVLYRCVKSRSVDPPASSQPAPAASILFISAPLRHFLSLCYIHCVKHMSSLMLEWRHNVYLLNKLLCIVESPRSHLMLILITLLILIVFLTCLGLEAQSRPLKTSSGPTFLLQSKWTNGNIIFSNMIIFFSFSDLSLSVKSQKTNKQITKYSCARRSQTRAK